MVALSGFFIHIPRQAEPESSGSEENACGGWTAVRTEMTVDTADSNDECTTWQMANICLTNRQHMFDKSPTYV